MVTCLAPRSPPPAPATLAPCMMTSIRVSTVPLWMPCVSWVLLLNPLIGSCVHTRHLIQQNFEHKSGWASGVCVCKRHHFTFITFLASQKQVFGSRHPSVHQLPWMYVLMSASGSCWGPGQATEGPLPVHYSFFFILQLGFLYSLSPRRTAEQIKYHVSKEQRLGSHIYLWTD